MDTGTYSLPMHSKPLNLQVTKQKYLRVLRVLLPAYPPVCNVNCSCIVKRLSINVYVLAWNILMVKPMMHEEPSEL